MSTLAWIVATTVVCAVFLEILPHALAQVSLISLGIGSIALVGFLARGHG
jgi:hypothetical protein